MGKSFDGHSLYAASIFRNKSLIAADLRNDRGRELIRQMAAQCDVMIENFRPGRIEEWGLGYDELSRDNPGLVMVRISGFGQDGPYRDRPGYGVIGEAVSGLRHLTGDPDRPPARVAVSMTDYITGLYAAFGALLALLEREKTGHGQVVDAALYEAAFSFTEPWIPAYEKLGHVANRCGSRLPESTPNNLYLTGDEEYIHITAPSDGVFARLTQAMATPELKQDPRFETARARSDNQETLDEMIGDWTAAHTLDWLEHHLSRHEVPHTRIYTIADIFEDPHFAARCNIEDIPHGALGTVAMAGVVPRLSRTPGGVRHAGGEIGQDTSQVLADWLNLSMDEVKRLTGEGVIDIAEPNRSDR
jgi:crotonobetainyl-CoA:carnitine CoA-transferase CaiB-like acyl-CoA transferase